MKEITIYTDGACSGNPGRGGWAAILFCGEHSKEISGAEIETTNNRMELQAVIEALRILKYPSNVRVFSDSAYVVNAFLQKWIDNWIKNNWITSSKKAVLNKDLWLELVRLMKIHNVSFVKVAGHSDNEFNNKCDYLARSAIKNMELPNGNAAEM